MNLKENKIDIMRIARDVLGNTDLQYIKDESLYIILLNMHTKIIFVRIKSIQIAMHAAQILINL